MEPAGRESSKAFQGLRHVAGQGRHRADRASIPHSWPGAPTLNASRLVTVADSCIEGGS